MLYINALLAFITHHPALAYGAIFLISLSESLALVGLIVPGTVIMFGVGAIVATGSLGLEARIAAGRGRGCRRRRHQLLAGPPLPGRAAADMAVFPLSRHVEKWRGLFSPPWRQKCSVRTFCRPGTSGHPGCGRNAGHGRAAFQHRQRVVGHRLGPGLYPAGCFFRDLAGSSRSGQHAPGRAHLSSPCQASWGFVWLEPQAGITGRT